MIFATSLQRLLDYSELICHEKVLKNITNEVCLPSQLLAFRIVFKQLKRILPSFKQDVFKLLLPALMNFAFLPFTLTKNDAGSNNTFSRSNPKTLLNVSDFTPLPPMEMYGPYF